MTRCNKCFELTENKIAGAFRVYGRFVARHPWKIVLTSIIINGLLGLGMIHIKLVEKMFIPNGSQASKDGNYVEKAFPGLSASNILGHKMPDSGLWASIIVRPHSRNAIDADFLTSLNQIYTYVNQISTTDEHGNIVQYTDLCAKTSGSCSVAGDLFIDSEFISAVSSNSVDFPFFNHSTRGPIYYEQYVSDASVISNKLQSASMLLLTFNLHADSDYFISTWKKWQASFLDAIEMYNHSDFEVAYCHSGSLSEEMSNNVAGDMALFPLTLSLMITYACAATLTARCDVVGQRLNLGFAGVLAAGLAIVAAFGLGSFCGVEFVSIVGAIPFLIIGIGVDDMFLLLSGIANTDYSADIEKRIGETMATSGVSITITSLTDFLAFAAGSLSVFPSVRSFCIYAGIAVVLCYLNQATLFMASIAINEKRSYDNRHFATCLKVRYKNKNSDHKHNVYTGQTGACFEFCCTGRPAKNRKEAESYLDRVPAWLIPKLTSPLPLKVFILICFTAFLGMSVYGVTRLEEGIDFKEFVSEDSYYNTFSEWFDNFPQDTMFSVVFTSEMTYSDPDTEMAINNFITTMKRESTVDDTFEINWFSAFGSSANKSSETAYIASLQAFLAVGTNNRYRNDIVIDTNRNVITSSRIHLISESVRNSQTQGKFMLRMRELARDNFLSITTFSPAFIFYEQYVIILSQTLRTVSIAVAMVFFVTCIFMPHPFLLLYITATVAMITLGIFGFLPFLGLSLSAVTMVHVIMSIGFSVDFAVHICHAYMIASGENRNERMQEGIKRSGVPIFHGAISTFLGVAVLVFAKSLIFFSFFQVMSLVVTFWHFTCCGLPSRHTLLDWAVIIRSQNK